MKLGEGGDPWNSMSGFIFPVNPPSLPLMAGGYELTTYKRGELRNSRVAHLKLGAIAKLSGGSVEKRKEKG